MDGYIAQFQRVENCAMDLVDAKMTNE